MFAARQFINHGHVKVNGRRVNIASFKAKVGDVVEVKESSKQLTHVLEASQLAEAAEGTTLAATGGYRTKKLGGDYRGGTIGASPAYSFTAHVAEVEVDEETGIWKVLQIWAAHDCGKALNPTLVEGQIEGSVYMGAAEAQMEEMVYDGNGLLFGPSLLDYRIPTSLDTPEIDARIVESIDPNGPYGAKEAGEGPLIVLLQVAQLGTEWQAVRFTLLGVSILCYAARLGLTQYRQNKTEDTLQRHNRAMDSAVNGIAIVDAKGQHTYANAAFAQMLGHESAGSIVGRPWQDVYAPQDVERVEKEIRESLRKTGKWYGPMNIHRRDGSALPVEMAITSLPDGGVVCVSRDMTAKRDAENARAQAEAKYKMLVEQVAAISYIAELGIHGEWLYVSPQVETMFGFSTEEWLGDSKAWTQHVHPEDHKIVEAAEAASQRGERFQAEYRVVRKDGRVIWVSDTAVVVEGSDAHPLMEGIIVDITERKQLETQLQQARRMEAIGRLAGGIAHDFNNLLTIIKGYTELALNRPKISPELQADVERIEDASERASTLVRQLLAFSRRQVLQPKLLDLNSIVMGLDKLLRRLMDEAIQMSTVPGKNIGTIKADPGQMEQVIMNLVVNARDAMPNGGRLTVETANVELDAAYASDHATVKPGQYVMLAVSDTGTGMSPETVAHIFEPFYTTKESGRGTGLGLSTVYGIVKQSGGYVWVYSEVGRGSSFKVYLPRVEEAAEALGAVKVASGKEKGSETILLVEDEAQVRELVRMTLSEKGYTVLVASSPEDAESVCAKHGTEIHLLLTDLIMPGATGRELAKRLTARHPKMRVLYMSGYTFGITTQTGMPSGLLEDGVAFLQKPFTPSALGEKVREALDRSLATTES